MSLKVIRGIDVCTDELGIPTWVLAPILRYLDDAGKIASQHLKLRFGEEVPPLRKTVHSGEDFVHLIGGLRRIDEAVRYFRLGPGDRIGHAMALGMEPTAWANRMRRVTMRIEDRLKDLIWEWTQYSSHVLQSESKRIAYVEREIARLSIKIFYRNYTPFELENLFGLLHNEQMLKQVKYPYCELDRLSRDKNDEPECKDVDPDTGLCQSNYSFLKRYLTDPGVFERGNQPEWFSVIPEIETMITLQNHIRRKIGGLGIVVEVNPSSNLLIGNIADLKNHPFWRLDPPDKNREIPPVALCIGSDDPLTFATNLRKEYAIVY
jgi:hypothetical protein